MTLLARWPQYVSGQVSSSNCESGGMCLTVSPLLRLDVVQDRDCVQAPALRAAAAQNLGNLAPMVLRIDQLVNQLLTGARTCEPALREAHYAALRGVLKSSSSKVSAGVMSSLGAALQDFLRQCSGQASPDDCILLP